MFRPELQPEKRYAASAELSSPHHFFILLLLSIMPSSVLITGTSSGSVGSAIAASFAARDFIVFATLRTVSKIDPSLAALPNVHVLALDVTSEESIAAALENVRTTTDGKLDYLINNAGIMYTSPVVDVDFTKARKLFDVNFWGTLSITKAFMPLLMKSKGTVVNVSSAGAAVNTPWIGELFWDCYRGCGSNFFRCLCRFQGRSD